jgi:AraC-like DNA-binding protein
MLTLATVDSGRSVRDQAVLASGAATRPGEAEVLACRSEQFDQVHAELTECRSTQVNELEVCADTHVLLMRCEGTASQCEIVWPDDGLRQKLPELTPGSILLAPTASRMRMSKKDHGHFSDIRLQVPPSALRVANDLDLDSTRVGLRPQAGPGRAELRRILFAMRDEIASPGPVGQLYKETLALQLVIQLLRHPGELAIAAAMVKGGLSAYQLRRAIELLEADLSRPPSLRELAAHVGLSPAHFCTAFRQSTGHPPHRYLLNRRVARAKRLMAEPHLNLTEIALGSGFSSSSQFATTFRRIDGMTPSAYRRGL